MKWCSLGFLAGRWQDLQIVNCVLSFRAKQTTMNNTDLAPRPHFHPPKQQLRGIKQSRAHAFVCHARYFSLIFAKHALRIPCQYTAPTMWFTAEGRNACGRGARKEGWQRRSFTNSRLRINVVVQYATPWRKTQITRRYCHLNLRNKTMHNKYY